MKTSLVVTLGSGAEQWQEMESSLAFGDRAVAIQNRVALSSHMDVNYQLACQRQQDYIQSLQDQVLASIFHPNPKPTPPTPV